MYVLCPGKVDYAVGDDEPCFDLPFSSVLMDSVVNNDNVLLTLDGESIMCSYHTFV
jgi:hypothetical protein